MIATPERRKHPELVRRSLLDRAAGLAVEKGVAAATVQAVAEAAGVTKGGLFHHFPSKQALIEAVFADLLRKLDETVDTLMDGDEGHGAFTRAYVGSVFVDRGTGVRSPWAALSVSMITDPRLKRLWSEWLRARLTRHRTTDAHPGLDVVRLAADGVWLADLLRAEDQPSALEPGLRERLIALTKGRDR